jgi:hypothetical protein
MTGFDGGIRIALQGRIGSIVRRPFDAALAACDHDVLPRCGGVLRVVDRLSN